MSGTSTAELRARRSGILYADTSALLKLAVHEDESEAFAREVVRWRWLATSRVTNVELPRALARARVERPDALLDRSAVIRRVLRSTELVELDDSIAVVARGIAPVHTSALDAIHIASAISLDAGLAAVATYDLRMQEALAGLGVDVIAPA